ncbi:hypothetical protein BJ508DRAFT_334166 [Ascobolus immersus RN42]|uniref:Uncharacterized protein n=1 Tax=Ascobolus immersus RN42 TaxID=1160509 RepID=A0A3N4HKD1_ASCIM|nr:hypothetical protein BJ508DRAFT_334166 [Ascobolus immersus RN42]
MPCTKPQHAFAKHNTTDWKRNGQSQLIHSCEHICNYCYMVFNRPDTSRDLRKHLDYGACPRLPKDVTPKFHISHHPRSGHLSKQMPKEEVIGLSDPRFLWYCRILLENDVHQKQFGAYYNIIQRRIAPYNGLTVEYLASLAKDFTPDMPDLKLNEEFPDIGCGPGGKAIPLQIISIEGLSARPEGLRVTTSEMLREKLSKGGQESCRQSQPPDGNTPPGPIPTPTAGFPRLVPLYGFQPPPSHHVSTSHPSTLHVFKPHHIFTSQPPPHHVFTPQPPLQQGESGHPHSGATQAAQHAEAQHADTFSFQAEEEESKEGIDFMQAMELNVPQDALYDMGDSLGSTGVINEEPQSQSLPLCQSKAASTIDQEKPPRLRTPNPPQPVQQVGVPDLTPSQRQVQGARASSVLSLRTTPSRASRTPTPGPLKPGAGKLLFPRVQNRASSTLTPTPAPSSPPSIPATPSPRSVTPAPIENQGSTNPPPSGSGSVTPATPEDQGSSHPPRSVSTTPKQGNSNPTASGSTTPTPPTPSGKQGSNPNPPPCGSTTPTPPTPPAPIEKPGSLDSTTRDALEKQGNLESSTPAPIEHQGSIDSSTPAPIEHQGSMDSSTPAPIEHQSSMEPGSQVRRERAASFAGGTQQPKAREIRASSVAHTPTQALKKTPVESRYFSPFIYQKKINRVRQRSNTPHSPLALSSDVDMDDIVDSLTLSPVDILGDGSDAETDESGTEQPERSASQSRGGSTETMGDDGPSPLIVKLSVDPVKLRDLLFNGQGSNGDPASMEDRPDGVLAASVGGSNGDPASMEDRPDGVHRPDGVLGAPVGGSSNAETEVSSEDKNLEQDSTTEALGILRAEKTADLDSVDNDVQQPQLDTATSTLVSDARSSPSNTTEEPTVPLPAADTTAPIPMDIDEEQTHRRPTPVPDPEKLAYEPVAREIQEPTPAPPPAPAVVPEVRRSRRTRIPKQPDSAYQPIIRTASEKKMDPSRKRDQSTEEDLDIDHISKRCRTSSPVGETDMGEESEDTAVLQQLNRESLPLSEAGVGRSTATGILRALTIPRAKGSKSTKQRQAPTKKSATQVGKAGAGKAGVGKAGAGKAGAGKAGAGKAGAGKAGAGKAGAGKAGKETAGGGVTKVKAGPAKSGARGGKDESQA